jgi:glycosyltransferase involved in cell wall biosynthesis
MISKALVVATYRSKLVELSRLGAEMTAVVPPSWKEEGQAIALEPADGHQPFSLVKTPVAWNGHFHVHYYPALDRIVRQYEPDIVHVDEEPYNLATYLAYGSARRSGASRLFFTWQNINRQYPLPFRRIERWVYARSDYALAGNQEARQVLRDKGYEGPAKVIPQFGVDIHRFTPTEHPDRPFTVGFLNRLVAEKGIGDLMEAFKRLEIPARLVIAGEGPMAEYVELATADLKKDGRVERYPRVPSAQMPLLLSRLDVVVLPSRSTARWREQYGRILVEAMACGVPVVGSSSGEIPNVIGKAGIVFPEGDSKKLAEALTSLAEDRELRRKLAVAGRERAIEHFSQESIAAQTYAVYQDLMNGDNGA